MTIKEKTMVLTKTYKNNGNDDDKCEHWQGQRQTKTMVMMMTDKNNGNCEQM